MATGIEAIEASIRRAVEPGFHDRLVARGQARSMIWRDGVLPSDAPAFSGLLTYDLLSYGYSLLGHGLRVLEQEGNRDVARIAFEHAAGAIEAVIAKGRNDDERGFHRLIAASAYHLGRFSARAYSLIRAGFVDTNLSIPERCLGHLILRDLEGLSSEIIRYSRAGRGSDDALVRLLSEISSGPVDGDGEESRDPMKSEQDLVDVLDLAIAENFVGAMGTAMLAFERGEPELLDVALARLELGLEGSRDFNLVPQWWCHRLTVHLLRDLWDSSFHKRLPLSPAGTLQSDWPRLRKLFIAVLYRRSRAEIELWPSQLDAAAKALNLTDNLVVSLPTSAGKTRIAELCILACLANGKRVVFVTPLRALSAQTEVGLLRTFQPLGKSVSSLYGSIGVSNVDTNVGLIVFDEGHMIGLGEREVRYEVQIQRLLKRADADNRRIICLSAILPGGTELDDFVGWITGDNHQGLLSKNWRPTRLRFGEVDWRGDYARLTVQVGDEKPFVPRFLTAEVPPIGRRTTPFPKDQRELCLATAWRLVEDGQSVLIFCPLRRSVEPFATAIVDLNNRGALKSVLECDESILATALAIGSEWFGSDHALLKCLKLGVAVHHGALPTPFRREVERLLREGVLKITISSPTLAQGLNLSATTLVIHGLVRNRKTIESSEFRNVVGRAGRAYVDLEGLVLYPMFDEHIKRREDWNKLVSNDVGREMESGLLRLLAALLGRMQKKIGTTNLDSLADYVLNNANAWVFPALAAESTEQGESARGDWEQHLTSLDTAILSLLGEQDVADDRIEEKLDAILGSSLFERRLARRAEGVRVALRQGLTGRARYVWTRSTPTQRRGYFLAGVGLNTGQELDTHASKLNELLIQANGAILNDQRPEAIKSITDFAELIFRIPPFSPEHIPVNWKEILAAWLRGEAIASVASGNHDEVLQFIEQGLVYHLPWGMEAVRVRGLAHDDVIDPDLGFKMSDFDLANAVGAVEAGTLHRSAALLIRSGFSSRSAAIKAVEDGIGVFTTPQELRRWLASDVVSELSRDETWPTPETNSLWRDFIRSLTPSQQAVWSSSQRSAEADWAEGLEPLQGTALRVAHDAEGKSLVLTSDCERIGMLKQAVNPVHRGLLVVTAGAGPSEVILDYVGPDDLYLS